MLRSIFIRRVIELNAKIPSKTNRLPQRLFRNRPIGTACLILA
jgi:hypothetical protein